MTLPLAALRVWADAIADPGVVRTGATRFRLVFSATVDLDDFAECDWSDAGFTPVKLRYLQRRYPPNDLPDDGCIAELTRDRSSVVYRRVDVTRGWLADVLYLKHLGWRGLCRFSCGAGDDGLPGATLHAVLASAVAPVVVKAGLWRGASPILARTLRRAVVHRLERRYETRANVRRVNDWAHRISDADSMLETIRLLDDARPELL